MNITLTPDLSRFVEKKVKEGPSRNASEVVREALRALMAMEGVRRRIASGLGPLASGPEEGAKTGLGAGSDVASLVFTVLMDAVKGADADLALIMAEVKAITNTKQALRDLVNRVGRDVAANAGQKDGNPPLNLGCGMGSSEAYESFPLPNADPRSSGGVVFVPTNLVPGPGPIATVAQLRAILDQLRGDLDSLNEMSEMASLRLQMTMDRRAKLITTLSNVLKKIDATQDTLVENLK